MKRALARLIILLIASSAFAQIYFQGSLEEAMARAKAEKKLVLIDFFSPG